MSRERAKRISPLVKIAENAVQEALSYLGSVKQRIEQEKQKGETLQQYQLEYQQGFSSKGSTGINGSQIQQHQAFIAQIDTVLAEQKFQIKELEKQYEQAHEIYLSLNRKLKTYEKLQNRLTSQAEASENRQLQGFLDELSAQIHRRNNS